MPSPGTGISSDVWPSAYAPPGAATPPAAGDLDDDEVRARIRAAWATPDDDGSASRR
ncbi:hypothetical protein [Microbacterium trichothecenolyticum]|uniref:Uncharacterized protein n=1 Tax=Microbacterium trichothecenolyticum TaxID=69370 RepID=A0ABU0TTT6_MICTR|nr:hypothetical protein [Microbacterium trichothecenolyticum]MDQ1123076.1 hypothetical protein [Microbacterium trichothecenolyticum]